MNFYKYIFIVASAVYLSACDPAISGSLKIYNDTSQTLTVRYVDVSREKPDTIIKEIQPNSSEDLKLLSGLGDKKSFDCCPCELKLITVSAPTGKIKKDPANTNHWTIPNKSKLKRFGKEPVKCEFHVTAADL